MRKFLKFITGRLAWTILFFLIQVVIIFATLKYAESSFGLSVFNFILGFVVSFAIFTRNDAPEYKLSWILLISVFPIFGCFMYLIFGNKKKGKWERRKIKNYQELMKEHKIGEFSDDSKELSNVQTSEIQLEDIRLQQYLTRLTGSLPSSSTEISYYSLGDYCYPVMLEELKKLRSSFSLSILFMKRAISGTVFCKFLKTKFLRVLTLGLCMMTWGALVLFHTNTAFICANMA